MISKNRLKQIRTLHLKKNRDAESLFLAEGLKTVTELLEHNPDTIHELFATVDFIEENNALLKKNKVNFSEISGEELKQISTQVTPNKVLAVCHYFNKEQNNLVNFSLYLDEIRDPGNFGTIIRLANWFGISTIYCSENSCDFYNPKVIQSTMGAFMRVNVVYTSLNKVIKDNGIKIVYGAVLNGKNIYTEKLEKGIIVIGNEASGISAENLNLVNRPITIPSHQENGTESLNAAMAASIITSEFFRQLS